MFSRINTNTHFKDLIKMVEESSKNNNFVFTEYFVPPKDANHGDTKDLYEDVKKWMKGKEGKMTNGVDKDMMNHFIRSNENKLEKENRELKRRIAIFELLEVINELDVDEEFKEEIREKL